MSNKFLDINSLKIENVSIDKNTLSMENKTISKIKKNDIAIIGMSCKAASANNAKEFWDMLVQGEECLRDIDEQRKEDIYSYLKFKGAGQEFEKPKFQKYNCMDDIDKFDYDYFKITPAEAELMDPKQRLFLESAWNALEDAGYCGNSVVGSNTGVFLGTSISRDSYLNLLDNVSDELLGKVMTGNLPSIIASRISYILDLKGPSFAIDTACSSALVALHYAIQSLNLGDCNMAIVGGVDYCFVPQTTDSYNIGISSSDLRTKAFDDNSDGTNSGEAVVTIVIKQLHKAIKDNDPIYAIIKGSAINQDGKSVGITAPNMESQEKVILKAWREAGIPPETISYIETHGTGTKLGDPIEVNAISNAFRKFTDKKQFCGIGSVKTNIGHTNAVSGLVSLVKVVLAMQHKQIPASLNFKVPNRNIDFIDSPVYVNNMLREWNEDILRCGVSSFGLSGTNAHIVLEEYGGKNDVRQDDKKHNIFAVSANSMHSLYLSINRYVDFLRENTEINLSDFCYTANVTRKHCKFRYCFITQQKEELLEMLIRMSAKIKQKNADIKQVEIKDFQGLKSVPVIQEFVESGLSDVSKLQKIADLYLQGNEIDWALLYSSMEYYKLNIPVYPFDSKRCWHNVDKDSDSAMFRIVGRDDDSYSETEKFLALVWHEVFGYNEVNIFDNFNDFGIDSMQTVAYFSSIRKKYVINVTDIYTNPSIFKLASYIENSRMNLVDTFNEFKNMYLRREELVNRFANHEFFSQEFAEYFSKNEIYENINFDEKIEYANILLTGVTGYLGVYILRELLRSTKSNVYLLMRKKDKMSSMERLREKWNHFFEESCLEMYKDRIIIIDGELSKDFIGLSESDYKKLAQTVDCIFHSAAYTSHFGIYEDFYQANVLSTRNLLDFAKEGIKKDFNYISTYGVAECKYTNVDNMFFSEYDQSSLENIEGIRNYYVKTKILAEDLVSKAREEGLRINIFRMDNIAFEYENGTMQENIENNAFCLLVRAFLKIGVVPDIMLLFDCSFIDYIARAIGLLFNVKNLSNENFHIANPNVLNLPEILSREGITGADKKISLDDFVKYSIKSYDMDDNSAYIQDITVHLMRGGSFDDSGDFLLHIENAKTNLILKKLGFTWDAVDTKVFNRFIDYCKKIKFL